MERFKKYRFKFIMLIMFIFPLSVSASNYGESRNLSLSSKGISEMKIDCGAGFLELKGIEGLNEIRVRAEIIAGNRKGEKLREYIEENVELSLEKKGNRAVLISRINHYSFSIFRGNSEYLINLTIEVPSELNLSIKDGSRNIDLSNTNGELEINDGSGSIEIADINGRVRIHDGSGDLYMDNVNGDVEIEDGSGSIDVRRLTGDLAISDGSGGIEAKSINGDLNIIDGSGSLWTSDIDGNLEIRDGSGSIFIDGVSNHVDILESGSGGVQFKNVKGSISGDL